MRACREGEGGRAVHTCVCVYVCVCVCVVPVCVCVCVCVCVAGASKQPQVEQRSWQKTTATDASTHACARSQCYTTRSESCARIRSRASHTMRKSSFSATLARPPSASARARARVCVCVCVCVCACVSACAGHGLYAHAEGCACACKCRMCTKGFEGEKRGAGGEV